MTLSPLLSSIEARVKAATPGKWWIEGNEGTQYIFIEDSHQGRIEIATAAEPADGDLIVYAKTDLTRLIAICRGYEKLVEALHTLEDCTPGTPEWNQADIAAQDAESALATLLKEPHD